MKKKNAIHKTHTHIYIYIYTYNNTRAQCNNEQRKIMKEKKNRKKYEFL